LEYFFSLSLTEKLFCFATMELARKEKFDILKAMERRPKKL